MQWNSRDPTMVGMLCYLCFLALQQLKRQQRRLPPGLHGDLGKAGQQSSEQQCRGEAPPSPPLASALGPLTLT